MQIHKWANTAIAAVDANKASTELKNDARALPTMLRELHVLNTLLFYNNKTVEDILKKEIQNYLSNQIEDPIFSIPKLNIIESYALLMHCNGFAVELKRYANAMIQDVTSQTNNTE